MVEYKGFLIEEYFTVEGIMYKAYVHNKFVTGLSVVSVKYQIDQELGVSPN